MSVKEQKQASVQAEIARERAESLARGAQRLRTALQRLRDFDAGTLAGRDRSQLVSEASAACLAYLVQREGMGLGAQDAQSIRKEYDIPPEVWGGMGALSHS